MKIARQNILIAGIPGSGKTTYCRWLERERGFLHVDFDELQNRRGTAPKLLLYDHLRLTAEDFLRAISKKKRPIVIDWGFPPAMISLVSFLKLNGFAIWWFDGELGCRQEILSAAGHGISGGFYRTDAINRSKLAFYRGSGRTEQN